jgi:hypothetical protein
MSFDSGLLCDFNTALLQMKQKLLSLFLHEQNMLHTRKILLKHTGKMLHLHWYNAQD